jgi:hypothetical protein
MKENIDYKTIRETPPVVYVIQEIAGTRDGRPKINIMGAAQYGVFKFLLPELSQIIFSPGPFIINRRSRNYWSSLFYSF